jgi:serine protease Do
VVGVNVAYVPPEAGAGSLGFAIPSDTVISVADQLIEDGEAVHPYLGISLADAASEVSGSPPESGAVVTEVEPDGPSEEAGVVPEDVVTAIGSVAVEDSGDLLGALRDYAPGEDAQLTLTREGEGLTVDVPLGERNG